MPYHHYHHASIVVVGRGFVIVVISGDAFKSFLKGRRQGKAEQTSTQARPLTGTFSQPSHFPLGKCHPTRSKIERKTQTL